MHRSHMSQFGHVWWSWSYRQVCVPTWLLGEWLLYRYLSFKFNLEKSKITTTLSLFERMIWVLNNCITLQKFSIYIVEDGLSHADQHNYFKPVSRLRIDIYMQYFEEKCDKKHLFTSLYMHLTDVITSIISALVQQLGVAEVVLLSSESWVSIAVFGKIQKRVRSLVIKISAKSKFIVEYKTCSLTLNVLCVFMSQGLLKTLKSSYLPQQNTLHRIQMKKWHVFFLLSNMLLFFQCVYHYQ